MRVQVTFQVNTVTGEVEVFQIDDLGQTRRLADHDARHEDVARALAEILDPGADVEEVLPASGQAPAAHRITATPASSQHAHELDGGTG